MRLRMLAARSKQPVVLGLDGSVALARGAAERVGIVEFDMSAAVVDEIGLLQRVGHQRYAVAARADHLRHRLLGQDKLVAAGKVARVSNYYNLQDWLRQVGA